MMNTNGEIREIWRHNRGHELCLITEILSNCPFIAIDTEFPGHLRNIPTDSTEASRYDTMKFNVDNTKIIQFGFTLFDAECRIKGSWEVNFSDFDETQDHRNQNSIDFLRSNGIDFPKIREEGVSAYEFFQDFLQILRIQKKIIWVTFHGSYDVAYLVKMFSGLPLPPTLEAFADSVGRTLGSVYDMKAMAGRIEGLSERYGLETLADEVGVSRQGSAHHAGSDSLLTAQAFVYMIPRCRDLIPFEGFIHGVEKRVMASRAVEPATAEEIKRMLMAKWTSHEQQPMYTAVSPYARPYYPINSHDG